MAPWRRWTSTLVRHSVGSDRTNPYSTTWLGVPTGTYAIKAVATDDRGTATTSTTVTVTVSPTVPPNRAPTVSVTTDKSSYTAPATVAIAATAADSDGTVAKVEFFAGTTLLATDASSPFAYSWVGPAVGTYAIKAVATDDRGAATTSATTTVTVLANQAPTVSVTTDKSSYTAPATVAIAATAADSDGTVAKVEFYAGTTLLATDASSPFAYSWTGAAAGTYAIKAVATDDRGAATTSATAMVTVLANQAPTVSVTTDKSSYTAPATVAIAATAADSDGTVARVEFYAGTTLLSTDTSSPFAFSWTGAAAGTHAVKAVATDDRGAWTSATTTVTVVVNAAPTVSVTTDKSSYMAPATVAMTAAAADSDGTVAKVEFYAGTTLLWTDASSPFAYSWTGAAAGTYAIKAVATDDRGAATTSATTTVTVVVNAAPTVSVTTDKSSYMAPATVAMTAAAADSDGTVAKVDFYAGTTLLWTDASSPFAYSWTGAAAGTYAIKAVATDDQGAATTSATVNITVAANAAPTVSVTTDKSSYMAPATVAMTAAAADSDGTVAKVEFYAGTTLLWTDASSPFAYSWTGAAAGTYAIKAVATDDRGAATTSATREHHGCGEPGADGVGDDGPEQLHGAGDGGDDGDGGRQRRHGGEGGLLRRDDAAGDGCEQPVRLQLDRRGGRDVCHQGGGDGRPRGGDDVGDGEHHGRGQPGADGVVDSSGGRGQLHRRRPSIALAATAADSDGTVAKVDFYAGATLVGTDATQSVCLHAGPACRGRARMPSRPWRPTTRGRRRRRRRRNITVTANEAPTVSLTAPAGGASYVAPGVDRALGHRCGQRRHGGEGGLL